MWINCSKNISWLLHFKFIVTSLTFDDSWRGVWSSLLKAAVQITKTTPLSLVIFLSYKTLKGWCELGITPPTFTTPIVHKFHVNFHGIPNLFTPKSSSSPATSQAKWNPSSSRPQRGMTLDFLRFLFFRFSVAPFWPWKKSRTIQLVKW